jgi:hypothetical protein
MSSTTTPAAEEAPKDVAERSSHGADPRGLAAGANPGLRTGRFGRMLSATPARAVPEEVLRDLARAMIKEDDGAPITEREPVDENPAIPAGYTYFGQFVDHDITFDPTPFATAERDTEALDDFRSPALDLDSMYGRGPDDQPYLYAPGTLALRVGGSPGNGEAGVGTRNDLFRLEDGTPLLGDKRNDENKIVSQIHGAFIALHNKVVERPDLLADFGFTADRPGTRFSAAATLVRWHYQWVVVNDYLRRITQPGTVDRILNLGSTPLLYHYVKSDVPYPYMPIEFAGAGFRFGHSQVRPSYSLNQTVLTAFGLDPATGRIPTFSRPDAAVPVPDTQNLNGFPGRLARFWGIDWSFFLDDLPTPSDPGPGGEPLVLPQPSYRIDALLVSPLRDLPEFFTDTDAAPESLVGHLAFRNLLRGQNLGLPSGEQAAAEFGLPVLPVDVLWGAGSRLLDESALDDTLKAELQRTRSARLRISSDWVGLDGPLAGNTPLWYYILREAEYHGVEHRPDDAAIGFGGQHLGPLGSAIVAETLIGLLWLDPRSYLHAHRAFRPLDAITEGLPLTLPRLVRFALA